MLQMRMCVPVSHLPQAAVSLAPGVPHLTGAHSVVSCQAHAALQVCVFS